MTLRSILFATLFLIALPVAAADVTGKWRFDVSLDQGSGSATFEFKQDGETLTGTYSGAVGEAKITGTVKGIEIRFQFDSDFGRIKYEGSIKDADHMEGEADYAGQADGVWTAQRAK